MKTNLIDFKKAKKTFSEIELDKDEERVELYKDLYKDLNKIKAIIDSATSTSHCLYHEDYKKKSELYITLHMILNILSEKMEDYKDNLNKLSFLMDNVTYEAIEKRTEEMLLQMKNAPPPPTRELPFKIRVIRGEEISI